MVRRKNSACSSLDKWIHYQDTYRGYEQAVQIIKFRVRAILGMLEHPDNSEYNNIPQGVLLDELRYQIITLGTLESYIRNSLPQTTFHREVIAFYEKATEAYDMAVGRCNHSQEVHSDDV